MMVGRMSRYFDFVCSIVMSLSNGSSLIYGFRLQSIENVAGYVVIGSKFLGDTCFLRVGFKVYIGFLGKIG
uniref:Uncharacterized protein n=1 Tax=Rhizophora mucronata TaxID=61149 RepID=A0A2P2NW73_RHIMU